MMKTYKNGFASIEKLMHSGMYLVRVWVGTEIHDRILCDDYLMAREYYKSFCAIAKAA